MLDFSLVKVFFQCYFWLHVVLFPLLLFYSPCCCFIHVNFLDVSFPVLIFLSLCVHAYRSPLCKPSAAPVRCVWVRSSSAARWCISLWSTCPIPPMSITIQYLLLLLVYTYWNICMYIWYVCILYDTYAAHACALPTWPHLSSWYIHIIWAVFKLFKSVVDWNIVMHAT